MSHPKNHTGSPVTQRAAVPPAVVVGNETGSSVAFVDRLLLTVLEFLNNSVASAGEPAQLTLRALCNAECSNSDFDTILLPTLRANSTNLKQLYTTIWSEQERAAGTRGVLHEAAEAIFANTTAEQWISLGGCLALSSDDEPLHTAYCLRQAVTDRRLLSLLCRFLNSASSSSSATAEADRNGMLSALLMFIMPYSAHKNQLSALPLRVTSKWIADWKPARFVDPPSAFRPKPLPPPPAAAPLEALARTSSPALSSTPPPLLHGSSSGVPAAAGEDEELSLAAELLKQAGSDDPDLATNALETFLEDKVPTDENGREEFWSAKRPLLLEALRPHGFDHLTCHFASDIQDLASLRKLLQSVLDAHRLFGALRTLNPPLDRAVAKQLTDFVRTYPHLRDRAGPPPESATLLAVCARRGLLEQVRELVEEHQCDVNACNAKDETPLMEAVRRQRQAVIEYLLQKGANPLHENRAAETALQLASMSSAKHPEIFQLFQKASGGSESWQFQRSDGTWTELPFEQRRALDSAVQQGKLLSADPEVRQFVEGKLVVFDLHEYQRRVEQRDATDSCWIRNYAKPPSPGNRSAPLQAVWQWQQQPPLPPVGGCEPARDWLWMSFDVQLSTALFQAIEKQTKVEAAVTRDGVAGQLRLRVDPRTMTWTATGVTDGKLAASGSVRWLLQPTGHKHRRPHHAKMDGDGDGDDGDDMASSAVEVAPHPHDFNARLIGGAGTDTISGVPTVPRAPPPVSVAPVTQWLRANPTHVVLVFDLLSATLPSVSDAQSALASKQGVPPDVRLFPCNSANRVALFGPAEALGTAYWLLLDEHVPMASLPANQSQTPLDTASSSALRRQMVIGNCCIQVRLGDLTKERVGFIVNPANGELRHGGGVARQIATKCGPELKTTCDKYIQSLTSKPKRMPDSAVFVTGSFNLKTCQHVIHAVGPVWNDQNRERCDQLLQNTLVNCLLATIEHADVLLQSISVPAISSGIFQYPRDRVARILLQTAESFCRNPPKGFRLKEIRFVNIDALTADTFTSEFDKLYMAKRDELTDATAKAFNQPGMKITEPAFPPLSPPQRTTDVQRTRAMPPPALDRAEIRFELPTSSFVSFQLFFFKHQSKIQAQLGAGVEIDVDTPHHDPGDDAEAVAVSGTVRGTPAQTQAATAAFRRWKQMEHLCQSGVCFYRNQSSQQIGNIEMQMLSVVDLQTEVLADDWKLYVKRVTALLGGVQKQALEELQKALKEKARQLMWSCLTDGQVDGHPQWREELQAVINDTVGSRSLLKRELAACRAKAFEELLQEASAAALKTAAKNPAVGVGYLERPLQSHLSRLFGELRQSAAEHANAPEMLWTGLPLLLQRGFVFARLCATGLPLFENSDQLLQLIRDNQVVSLYTGTGSGKSTLLPPLLFADGYSKVAVTQPRRLPCQLIAQRVEETCGKAVCGWQVAGVQDNAANPVVYLTDGLLREYLLADKLDRELPYQVVVLDEIHERGFNMDICIARLAQLFGGTRPNSKLRIVLCSATLDPAVKQPFLALGPNRCRVADFAVESVPLHHVEEKDAKNENAVQLVYELFQRKTRSEQVLCFLPSVREVRESVALFRQLAGADAFPLFAQQSASEQLQFLDRGSVFFSTNIAETSLTFPALKYVVDAGRINVARYDIKLEASRLEELDAPKSTLKQRRGRLGRTMPGEYYALYDPSAPRNEYPAAAIELIDLTDLEFALLRTSRMLGGAGAGVASVLPQLPMSPDPALRAVSKERLESGLRLARKRLTDLGVLQGPATEQGLTSLGEELATLPMVGGARMAKVVYHALTKFNCGQDALRLASVLMLGESVVSIVQATPAALRETDSDLYTLVRLFDALWRARQSARPTARDRLHAVRKVCQSLGIHSPMVASSMLRAMNSYEAITLALSSRKELQRYCTPSGRSGQGWEPLARALLKGYGDQVFVNMAQLQGEKSLYQRLIRVQNSVTQQAATDTHSRISAALLHPQSFLYRKPKSDPVPYVLATSMMYTSHHHHQQQQQQQQQFDGHCLLSVAGKIELEWLQEIGRLERHIEATAKEIDWIKNHYRPPSGVELLSVPAKNCVTLSGCGDAVMSAELKLRADLVRDEEITLRADTPAICRKLEEAQQANWMLFRPLQYRWKNQVQAEIDLQLKDRKVRVKARDATIAEVKKEFDTFTWWLSMCQELRPPNMSYLPHKLKQRDNDIEERIAKLTDPKRTPLDLWRDVRGPDATRETRMAVFAWVAVCKFNCTIEGGFVRDWVVGNYTARPSTPPAQWLRYKNNQHPAMVEEVVPADVDVHLPHEEYFSVDRFIEALHRVGLQADYIERDPWRYTLVFDSKAPSGPFCAELIEPHVSMTHDMIDFDVSNLLVKRNYTQELGMRVDTSSQAYNITPDSIVRNIQKKQFVVMRPHDNNMNDRIRKMTQVRGWTTVGELHFVPNRGPSFGATMAPLPASDPAYQVYANLFTALGRVVKIEIISNYNLDQIYESMKLIIARENRGNANERLLFHGTKGGGTTGIQESGFDDRFWSQMGKFGRGAYFADDPAKSHQYNNGADPQQPRVTFVVRVLLGNIQKVPAPNEKITAPSPGYHAVNGVNPSLGNFQEYVVYRYGQAKPYLKISYVSK